MPTYKGGRSGAASYDSFSKQMRGGGRSTGAAAKCSAPRGHGSPSDSNAMKRAGHNSGGRKY